MPTINISSGTEEEDSTSEPSSPVTPASISVASVSSNSLRISSETLEQLEQAEAGFRVPTAPQPEEVILDLGDPTTTDRNELTSAEQEELRQLQQAWELRLQKIFQHDKYQTGSGQEHIDDNFLASLFASHEKEHEHFLTEPFARTTERKKGKNDGKYPDEKLADFDESGIALNKAIQIEKASGANNFTIPYSVKLESGRTHTSNVSIAYNGSEATKKIVISGKQDNIIIMLHTALKAKEKLGNNAKFFIYPSSDITAVAELLARCEVYGLNPEFKARPGQSNEAFQEFLVNTNKDNFQQLIADFKTQYAIKEDYKPHPAYTPAVAPEPATTPSTPTSPAKTSDDSQENAPLRPSFSTPVPNPLDSLNKHRRHNP